jgi:hypothetical protein
MNEKKVIHKELAAGRWFTIPFLEQMAHIGGDVERTISWKNRGNLEYSNDAFDRALELLDLTIADPKNKGGRRRELCRVREVLVDYIMYDNQYDSSDEFWQRYFFDFAYAAAIARGR